jgi:uncharacterized protein YjbI with pentapeptide repeats
MMDRLDRVFKWVDRMLSLLLQCCAKNIGEVLSWVAFLLVFSATLKATRWLWIYGDEWNGEATRSLGFALGGVAALYGLVLASKRLDAAQRELKLAESRDEFEKQQAEFINLQNERTEELQRENRASSFDKRVTDANSLLRNDSVATRCSAILLLEKYALDRELTRQEIYIIIQSLKAFIEGRTSDQTAFVGDLDVRKYEWPDLQENKLQRRDLELAIAALTRLASATEGHERVSLQSLDLRGLNLRNLDFSFFSFSKSNLNDVNFSNSKFEETDFMFARLEDSIFAGAECIGTNFKYAHLKGSDFEVADLRENTNFSDANLEGSRFDYLYNFDVVFEYTDVSSAQMDVEQTSVFEGWRKIIFNEKRPPSISVGGKSMLTSDLPSPQVGRYSWLPITGEWQCDFGDDANGTTVRIIAPWWKQQDLLPDEENQK